MICFICYMVLHRALLLCFFLIIINCIKKMVARLLKITLKHNIKCTFSYLCFLNIYIILRIRLILLLIKIIFRNNTRLIKGLRLNNIESFIFCCIYVKIVRFSTLDKFMYICPYKKQLPSKSIPQ